MNATPMNVARWGNMRKHSSRDSQDRARRKAARKAGYRGPLTRADLARVSRKSLAEIRSR